MDKTMEERIYQTPDVRLLELYSEGVLCDSVTEDNEIVDGEW